MVSAVNTALTFEIAVEPVAEPGGAPVANPVEAGARDDGADTLPVDRVEVHESTLFPESGTSLWGLSSGIGHTLDDAVNGMAQSLREGEEGKGVSTVETVPDADPTDERKLLDEFQAVLRDVNAFHLDKVMFEAVSTAVKHGASGIDKLVKTG